MIDDEYKRRMNSLLDKGDVKHDYYFNSYSSFYIHEEMLKDRVRTKAY